MPHRGKHLVRRAIPIVLNLSTEHALTTPRLLFERTGVRRKDETLFIGKLFVLAALLVLGGSLAVQTSFTLAACGVVLLAAAYTHAVELQHQCLHYSAFRKPRFHRLVGVPLGTPILVSYSHYRVRHLQHHRYLGTPKDAEFFGFDTRQPLTLGSLSKGLSTPVGLQALAAISHGA